jgi:hypothetical protein
MAGKPPDKSLFKYKASRLKGALPQIANRSGKLTANWMKDQAKQTTAFMDRTGSLRRSIKAGVLTEAKRGQSLCEIALSAGYEDVKYWDDDWQRMVSTDQYAASIELGGPNPWTRRNNAPRPFINPTAVLAAQMHIWGGFLKNEMTKFIGSLGA